jgi:hypothetical protein
VVSSNEQANPEEIGNAFAGGELVSPEEEKQREQVLKSRQENVALASRKFGRLTTSWWLRLLKKTLTEA